MAFPVEAAATGAGETVSTSSHTLNLPSGIAAGNLLVAVFHVNVDVAASFPADWSFIVNKTDTGAQRVFIYAKIADGTEGSSITVTTGATACRGEYRTMRFTGAYGSVSATLIPAGLAGSYTNTNNPDPPSLDPSSWGAEDTLWYAIEAGNDNTKTVVSYPTNYSNGVQHTSSGGTGGQLALASRQLNASSEDPGTFTLSSGGGSRTIGFTLAIRPASTVTTLIPGGIASTAGLGSGTLKNLNTLQPSGRASTLALGAHTLRGLVTLLPSGRPSGLVLGSHVLHALNTLLPAAIGPSLQYGTHTLHGFNTIDVPGIQGPVIALDSFTGTTGTRLQDHVMDRGYGWEEIVGEWEIFFNIAHLLTSQGTGRNHVVTESNLAETSVLLTITPPDHVGLVTMNVGIVINFTDSNHYWMVQFRNEQLTIWENNVFFGSHAAMFDSPLMDNLTHNIRVTFDANVVEVYVDEVLTLSYDSMADLGTPRDNAAGTKHGMWTDSTDQGTYLDNFQIGLDSMGIPKINRSIPMVSLPSAVSMGIPTLTSLLTLLPPSIASTLALGTPTIHGTLYVLPSGISPTSSFGNHTIKGLYTISPSGRASTASFGLHNIFSMLANTIYPNAIGSTLDLGGHKLNLSVPMLGKGSSLILGSPAVTSVLRLFPTAIVPTNTLGQPAISTTTPSTIIGPVSINSGIAYGLAKLNMAISIGTIGPEATLGVLTLISTEHTYIGVVGIVSTVTLGQHTYIILYPLCYTDDDLLDNVPLLSTQALPVIIDLPSSSGPYTGVHDWTDDLIK